MKVNRVELDESRMEAYAMATPEPARTLLRAIANGASPRALITSGQAAPRLLEDILCDAAAHGAVTGVAADDGEDLLFPAIQEEVRILEGERPKPGPLPEPVLDLGPPVYTSTPAPVCVEELATPSPAMSSIPTDASPIVPNQMPVAMASPRMTPPPRQVEPLPLPLARAIAEVAEPRVVVASPPPPMKTLTTLGSLTPPPVMPSKPKPRAVEPPIEPTPVPAPRPREYQPPSAFLAQSALPEKPKKESSTRTMWLLFAVAGIVFAVGARMARDREVKPATNEAPAATALATAAPSVAAASTTEPASDVRSTEGESKADPILPQDAPLRAEDKVPPGQGMIEIVAGSSDSVMIDGTAVGNGPIVKRALAPRKEPYEIRVKLHGEERVRFALVKEGRLTRLRVAAPWSR